MKPHSKSILALAVFSLVVAAFVTPSSRPAQAAGTWYVATSGGDGNDCLTPSTPCATINGAIGKAASGDTIKVAVGTYTSSSGETNVVVDKDLKLMGGWDSAFASQNSYSTVEGPRRGVKINPGQKATIARFIFQNGHLAEPGVGIYNDIGVLELKDSIVRNNTVIDGSWYHGSGIHNSGIMTITNSIVSGNTGDAGIYTTHYSSHGNLVIIDSTIQYNVNGGVANSYANVTITNTVISGNGGGITSTGEFPQAVLQIYGSAIVENFTANSGGGISAGGILTIANSTIARNSALRGAGIYAAAASLSNVTIAGNSATDSGGGLLGNFVLSNTVIANNSAATSPDCSGTLVSQGFNLIEDTTGCSITGDLTGNILGVDPLLFPILGSPGFHAVQPDSPTIDAGNPAGCADSQGNPLTTDQRGVSRPLDGDGNGSAICDIGAYEFDPANPIAVTQVFLPVANRDYCAPAFFDDFSNSSSGWPVGEDDLVRVEYLGGEYRILSKSGDYIYLFRSPACARQNYTVEMDARWVGGTGDSYGLLFGITSGFSQYYMFDMNTDYQMYRLYRRDPSGFTQVAPATYTSAIHGGTSSNHLMLARDESQIALMVNGVVLWVSYDGAITGPTWVGLMSNPYSDVPVSDARFDNFSVKSLQATSAGITGSGQAGVTVQGDGPAATTLYTTLPPGLEWKLPEHRIPQQPR